MKYEIWHDNDFDAAAWLFENLNFGSSEVRFRQIPKTNGSKDLKNRLTSDNDLFVLPMIRLETPDLILMRYVEGEKPQPLIVIELMTHTPQHDHPLQRYSRLYNAAISGIPSVLVLPAEKEKYEKGKRDGYKPTMYRANPLAYHLFIATSHKFKVDSFLVKWPASEGYLKYDKSHPTAPRVEGDIVSLISYVQNLIDNKTNETISTTLMNDMKRISSFVSGKRISDYALKTVFEVETKDVLEDFALEGSSLDKLLDKSRSVVYSPDGLKSGKNDFRTDPYGGKTCAFDVLFCRDDSGIRVQNLVLRANNVKAQHGGESTLLNIQHDNEACPFVNPSNWDSASSHFDKDCPYLHRKQQRIFGEIPDLVIFDEGLSFVS